MRWRGSAGAVLCASIALGGCATTDAEVRAALLVTASAVGKASCGAPIARRAEARVVDRVGDERYGAGRAIVRGSTGDGTACEGHVAFAYLRRDTPWALHGGQLAVTSAIVDVEGKPPPPPAEPRLAIGAPARGAIASAEGEAYAVDLARGQGVTLLARGPKPLGVEITWRGQALELAAPPGGAPFFVAPAGGTYVVRVHGPEGAPFVVAVLPGGVAGTPDGRAPESRP